jgi:hypothetical protein
VAMNIKDIKEKLYQHYARAARDRPVSPYILYLFHEMGELSRCAHMLVTGT